MGKGEEGAGYSGLVLEEEGVELVNELGEPRLHVLLCLPQLFSATHHH